jgi:hypothetical protein
MYSHCGGGTLAMKQPDGGEHPVAYQSTRIKTWISEDFVQISDSAETCSNRIFA